MPHLTKYWIEFWFCWNHWGSQHWLQLWQAFLPSLSQTAQCWVLVFPITSLFVSLFCLNQSKLSEQLTRKPSLASTMRGELTLTDKRNIHDVGQALPESAPPILCSTGDMGYKIYKQRLKKKIPLFSLLPQIGKAHLRIKIAITIWSSKNTSQNTRLVKWLIPFELSFELSSVGRTLWACDRAADSD